MSNEINFCQLGTTVEWHFKDFLKLSHSSGEKIEDATFSVANCNWQIWLYPKGYREYTNWVSLFLARLTGKDPVLISLKFSIKVGETVIQTLQTEKIYAEKIDCGYGYPEFIERSELVKHLTPELSSDSVILDGGLSFTILCSVYAPDMLQKCGFSTITECLTKENENFSQLFGRGGTTVEWQIKDFRNLSHAIGEQMGSPIVWMSNCNWQIIFYPQGNEYNAKDYVSLFLVRFAGKDLILTSVIFSIKVGETVIETRKFEHTFQKNGSRGIARFLKRSVLVQHLTPESSNDTAALDDELPFTIVCSVCVPDQIQRRDVSTETAIQKCDISTQTANSVKILTKDLEAVLRNQTLSDVKLKVGTSEYPAHRAVLAARSPVFASMFEHEMAENLNGVIDFSDWDSACVELFLNFLYTGHVDETSNTNHIGLYKMADMYGIDDLKKICYDFVFESLDIDTICGVLELAIEHEERELFNKAIEFFAENDRAIFVTENWKKFNLEKTHVANEILSHMS